MARTKEAAGSSKGASNLKKRKRKEAEPSHPKAQCPEWPKHMRLSEFPEVWHKKLYKNKVASITKKLSLIISEKKGSVSDLEPYGVVECFERLGWMNAYTMEGFDQQTVYLDEIITWMATLRKEPGRKPPLTTKLIGTVGGKEVELSFASLDEFTGFDTGAINPTRPYEYLSDEILSCADKHRGDMWLEMLRELFMIPPSKISMSMPLLRNDLKPLPKLLSIVVLRNVLPRTSDQSGIRNNDIRVLHALCTGVPTMSFKQLVLHNIWEARMKGDRKAIPHCRLLSKLLLNAGVISERSTGHKADANPFAISDIRKTEFTFTKSRYAYVLEDVKGRRNYERAREGQSEGDENDGDEDDEREEEEREYDRHERGRGLEISMQRSMEYPPDWGTWTSCEREMWRRQGEELAKAEAWREEQAKLAQERWEKQEAYEKSRIYERELEYNRRYTYMEEMRCYFDRISGREDQPCPQGYYSAWLPLQAHNPSHTGEELSSGPHQDPSDMQVIHTNLMESLFRSSQPHSGHDASGSPH